MDGRTVFGQDVSSSQRTEALKLPAYLAKKKIPARKKSCGDAGAATGWVGAECSATACMDDGWQLVLWPADRPPGCRGGPAPPCWLRAQGRGPAMAACEGWGDGEGMVGAEALWVHNFLLLIKK